jgi:YD repeat-containing protein
VWGAGSALLAQYSYFDNGDLQTVTGANDFQANVFTRCYSYDTNNRLTSISYGTGGNVANLGSYTYTLDGAGRKLTATDPTGETIDTYDAAGRLRQEQFAPVAGGARPACANTYQFDGASNRTSAAIACAIRAYQCDPNDRLMRIFAGGAFSSGYLYDRNGDTRQIQEGNEARPLNWDFDNCLRSTSRSGGGRTSYLYDAAGVRQRDLLTAASSGWGAMANGSQALARRVGS